MAVAVTTALVLLAVLTDSDASRVALPAIAGAAGTIAPAVVTVRLSIGNGNTRIGCASLMMPGRAQASTGSPAATDSAEQQILPELEDLGASVRSASRLVTRTKSIRAPARA